MVYLTPGYEETKRASERLFMRNAESLSGIETSPRAITADIEALAEKRKRESPPVFVSVIADPYDLYSFCLEEVREKVAHDGGDIRLGWSV